MKFLCLLILALSGQLLIHSAQADPADVQITDDKIIENKLLHEVETKNDNEEEANDDTDNDNEYDAVSSVMLDDQFANSPNMQRLARDIKILHNFNEEARNQALHQTNQLDEHEDDEAIAEERAVRKRQRIRRRKTTNKVKSNNSNKRKKTSRRNLSNTNSLKRKKNTNAKSKNSKKNIRRTTDQKRHTVKRRNGATRPYSSSKSGNRKRKNHNKKRGMYFRSNNFVNKSRKKNYKRNAPHKSRKSANDALMMERNGDANETLEHDMKINLQHDKKVAQAFEVLNN